MEKEEGLFAYFSGNSKFSKTFSEHFFSLRQIFLSLFVGKIFFLNFFFRQFGCKMKFGQNFVFPDPASRVSHEPLKLVTDPQVRHLTKVHFRQKQVICKM